MPILTSKDSSSDWPSPHSALAHRHVDKTHRPKDVRWINPPAKSDLLQNGAGGVFEGEMNQNKSLTKMRRSPCLPSFCCEKINLKHVAIFFGAPELPKPKSGISACPQKPLISVISKASKHSVYRWTHAKNVETPW